MKKSKDKKGDAVGAQDHLRAALDDITREMPLPASGTELILLEIDPHRAHAYWNIDPAAAQAGRPLVLRVHDITGAGDISQAHQSYDVEVHGLRGRWYLDFWRDDRTFVTEIGYRNQDGSLDGLARSNEITTPPAEPAAAGQEIRHIDPNGNPLHTDWPGDHAPDPVVEQNPAGEDPGPDAPVQEARPGPLVVEPVTLLNPDFPMADWPHQTPHARREEGVPMSQDTAGEAPAIPNSADPSPAAGAASVAFSGEEAELPGEFPPPEMLRDAVMENQPAVQAFYEAMAAFPPMEEPVAGAPPALGEEPAPAPPVPAAAPAPTPPPLEQIVGLSSGESGSKDVLLEVNAELHIYGRAKPGAELTIYGQLVKTRPDGSFSVRRILPHGAVVLPLLYTTSADPSGGEAAGR